MHRRIGVAGWRGVNVDAHLLGDAASGVADGPRLAFVDRGALPFMSQPRREVDRGSRIQLLAIVLVTLLVMVLGILVVVAPDRMGVPQPIATPATPTADDE
jgi:hypothetical protein